MRDFPILRSSVARRWWPVLAAVAGLFASVLSAAIPDAARADPRFRLGYLVVTHYPGVRSDGTGDATAGLQQAIDDAYAANLVCFLPLGTYVISDTLKCVQWHPLRADGVSLEPNPLKTAAYQFVGEHGSGGARPLIRLVPTAATAARFADSARPRPMLLLRLYESTRYPNPARTEPVDVMATIDGWLNDTSYLFDCRLSNVDFDCGGQAGAIGVVWPAAQGAYVESVRVDARGAHAGFYGLPGRNSGAINLEVVGGEYGIRHGYGAAQAPNREVCAGVTIVGARLIGQTRRAIDYLDFVPLVLIGFAIEKDFGATGATTQPPISVVESTNTSNNTLVLLDGSITLRNAVVGQVAIANPGNTTTAGKTLYLRNLYVTGTTRLVQATGGNGVSTADPARWHRIDEYAYADPRGSTGAFPAGTSFRSFATRSVLDGAVRSAVEPVARLSVDVGPPPTDLISRHLPSGGFPAYEGAASPPAAVVTEAPYGAVAGDNVDAATAARNTAALQAAIDAAAADPRLAGRVFLPKGVFLINNSLTLRANTRFFGAGKTNLSVLGAHASWLPSTTPGVLLQTVDDPRATTYVGNLDLQVPDRNLYEYPFTYLHWRAGAASMTFDLRAVCGLWLTRPRFDPVRTAPFVCCRFDGAGGGRHYFFGNFEQQFTSSATPVNGAGYRSIVIDRTSQPLWFYGFNNEGGKTDRRATDVELLGARHVVMLGLKREGGAPMLTLRDCRDVALLGGGAMREPPAERTGDPAAAYVEITGICSRITVAGLLVQQVGEGAGGYTVRETASDGAALAFPLGAALFQRGSFDWDAEVPGRVPPANTGGGDGGRLVNVAARVRVRAEEGPTIVGFVVAGTGQRTVLVRAVGPGLAALGVGDGVPDPAVRLYRGQTSVADNEDWGGAGGTASAAIFAAAGAFGLPAGSRDAALVATLGAGDYSAHATVRPGTGGSLVIEVFDLQGDASARLTNLSLLGRSGGAVDFPIVGFVLAGTGGRTVLARAVGPSLAAFGVADAVADPALRLFLGGRSLDGNDTWGMGAEVPDLVTATAAAGAFALPVGSRDAALAGALAPGAYTVHLLGGSGRVLAEIYAP
ncbi:MAG: hypothetical protein HZC55_21240 [Verrucomicrobia bacterium]|nr:hypothetical protein [Verrucomicrobiota bacterium]